MKHARATLCTLALLLVVSTAQAEDDPATAADSGLPPAVVGAIIAGALAGGGGYVCGRKTRVQVEPQPLAVEVMRDYVTQEAFAAFRAQLNKELRDIHARVDTVAPAVAEVKGELKRIAVVQEKILDLLLTNTRKKA